jgi:cytochrome P450/NADPH-cytochrome P450 reductase
VWGDNAETFRPERFAPENAEKLPPNCWKPFGSGMRACIGRPFAMQEAQLVLAMTLQGFDIALDDPHYQLEIKETLTLKPHGLKIRARPRHDRAVRKPVAIMAVPQKPLGAPPAQPVAVAAGATPLLVLFGSNAGSSQAFADRIAGDAPAQGYAPVLAPMDEYAGRLSSSGAVIMVTASYEGQPPDNARRFVTEAEGLAAGALAELKYAIFGCGNRQWARTYQAVPKRLDAALQQAGATRINERGETDSGGDFFGAFDAWYSALWSALGAALGKAPVALEPTNTLDVEFVKAGRETALRLGDLEQGTVIANRELVDMTKPGAQSRRHVEIRLPQGVTYRTGDYLAVLASNPPQVVERAIRRFGLGNDSLVILRGSAGGASTLPVDYPISVYELLGNYVELNQPATRAQVATIVAACSPQEGSLDAITGETEYQSEILEKRISVIDLLERYPACTLPFAQFLAMLPAMRVRQYSISSSPLWNTEHVTLTVAVLDAPALSGSGRYLGVASTFLAQLEPGDRISLAVRPSNTRFHPPADPAMPIIMICAGSGIAPFRGFIQERAAQKAGGRDIGPALLFFGAGDPDVDYLYRDEMTAWQGAGVVTALPAFSRAPDGDVKYVQHRVWRERARVADLFRQGATIYVCGDGRHMAPAVARRSSASIMRRWGPMRQAPMHGPTRSNMSMGGMCRTCLHDQRIAQLIVLYRPRSQAPAPVTSRSC